MLRQHDPARLLDEYIADLARSGRSRATQRKYRQVLNYLLDHVDGKAITEIDRADVRTWLDRWIDSSSSTLRLHITIAAGFFTWLQAEGLIEANPADGLKRPRKKKPWEVHRVRVSEDGVAKLIDQAHTWPELLAITMCAYLGPRRTAAGMLRWRDVELDTGYMTFAEKGAKRIRKPIPTEMLAVLRAAHSALKPSPGEYVVPNRRAASVKRTERAGGKLIYELVKALGERAGIEVTPHALRRAFATAYLSREPGRIYELQELMGHSSIETTAVYLAELLRERGMESVRGLSYGANLFPPAWPGLPPQAGKAHTGFEPVIEPYALPAPIQRKLDELRVITTASFGPVSVANHDNAPEEKTPTVPRTPAREGRHR